MIAAEWLRATMREGAPWWRLPPEQVRMALWLIAACEVRDGSPRLVATVDDIARYHRVTKQKVRRALDALERTGFCRVWGQRGRGGLTQIVLSDTRPFGQRLSPVLLQAGTIDESVESDTEDVTHSGHSPGHLPEGPEIKWPVIKPVICEVPETTDPSGQDLLRSSEDPDLGSDLPRSPTSQDLSRSKEFDPDGSAIWAVEEAGDEPAPAKESNVRTPPDRIPERSFAAADYLRSALLAENKAAALGAVKWSPESKTGRRLAWADSFRRLHAVVLTAMRNDNPEAQESSAWEEIARTVHWVFHGQQAELRYRIVVESPETLRDKWDAIQAKRRRQKLEASQPKPARGADGRPDPIAAREFKRVGW